MDNVRFGEDDGKLFAAVTSNKILATNTGAQALANLAQDGITSRVSPRIIDLFEMVEVYKEDRARAVGALAAGKFLIETGNDGAMIGQAGNGVGNGGLGLLVIKSIDLGQQLLLLLHEQMLFVVGFLQLGA